MSGITDPTAYNIFTQFVVGSTVPGLAGVTSQIQGLESRIGGMGKMITGAFAGLASAAGLKAAIGGVVGLNKEIQNAEFGIASLFSSLGKTDMATALGAARSQLKGLREDAAKGAGELKDFTSGFQLILGPSASTGAKISQIRELNRLALAAGFSMRGQEGLRLAPIDIVQMLGEGSSTETQIGNQALQNIGVGKKQFNAMSGAERFETLMKGFGTFKAAADAMGNTWDARMSTFGDNVKDLVRSATQPLFTRWNDELGRVNEWLKSHQAILTDMADNVGKRLVSMYDKIGKSAVGNSGGIAGAGAAAVGGGVGLRLGMAGAGALGLGGASIATGGIALLVAAFFATVTGSMMVAIKAWPALGQMLAGSLGALGGALYGFGEAVLRLFNNPVVALLGQGFVWMTTAFVKIATGLTKGLTLVIDLLGLFVSSMVFSTMEFIHEAAGKALGGTGDATGSALGNSHLGIAAQFRFQAMASDAAATEMIGSLMKNGFAPGKKPVIAPGTLAPGTLAPDAPFATNITNIGTVNITVEAERLDDPNTVASTFSAAFARISQFPTGGAGRFAPKPL